MIRGPFLDTAKARSYPFWCVCVTFSLCPLLPPGSSPLFFCVVRGVVCVVLWPPPSFCFPPLDGRFLVGWLRVVFLFFCLDTEDTALHNSSVVSPWLHWSHVFVTKDSSEAGLLFTAPPLLFNSR